MKKSLFLTACLAIASLSSFGTSLSSIMLQHNGSVTMFDSDKMTSAISAAVTGDTIYLSEGAFVGNFTIDKAITIIGAGQNTKIQGDITVSIDNTPTLTAHLLDAVSMSSNTLTISKAVKNVKIRKCYIREFYAKANVTDLNIDRCRFYSFYPQNNVKSGNVLNSYINSLSGYSGQTNTINYINCGIDNIYPSSFSGTFINSTIYSWYSTSTISNSVLINTRYPSGLSLATTSSAQNCYTGGSFSSYTDDKMGGEYNTIPSDWLEENNYVGTDGTIIGMFGGTSPFNLVPNVPTVTESKVSVDTTNKKLNVTLKVSAN